MAIADLLWACPICRTDRGIRRDRRTSACHACGTRFQRVDGARIRAEPRDGDAETLSPAQWLRRLPDPATLLEGDAPARSAGPIPLRSPEQAPVRSALVAAKFVIREEVVRDGDRYLNRIEIYGRKEEGTLTLTRERLIYTPADGAGEGAGTEWPFEDLVAVQASSRKLQLNGRDVPLASFAFPDDSSFLWENLVMAAVQAHYRRRGRGEIVEFQPRIRVA